MSEAKEAGSIVTSENREAFMAHRMGLSKPEVEDAVIIEEEKPEIKVEEIEVKDEHHEDEPGEDGKEKKNSPKLQKRFSELTRQREEARQEAAKAREDKAELEKRLQALEDKGREVTPKADANGKPDRAQFTDWGDYTDAMAQWAAKQALAERDKQDAEKATKAKNEEINSKWNERVKLAKQEIEDYDEVVASSDVKISDVVRDAILESDVGPQIIYHLAEDSEFADKLNQMTVQAALKAIGRLEAKFEKTEQKEVVAKETKKEVKVSKAPAPISPIKSGSVPAVELDENGNFGGSFSSYKAARKAGRIK